MLPLKLTLDNFMPYRGAQEPLMLDGLGVACLSGPNGAGKSALLDAITWALWGRSRAGASAEQLVAAGMAEMNVALEFRSHGVEYRVERRHQRRARGGNTTLDFQMRDGDRWRALNGQTVTETNNKLIETIRLDYETFINSAFLVQGKADMFVAQRGPAERKRILGEILNLSIYENYAETARRLRRDNENRQSIAKARIEAIETELQQEAEIREAHEEAQARTHRLEGEREAAQRDVDRLDAQITMMQSRKRDMEETLRRVEELTEMVSALATERDALRMTIASAESVLERRPDIEAGWQELKRTREALTEYGERSRRHTTLREKAAQLELADKEEQARLVNALAAAERARDDVKNLADQLPALQTRLLMTRNVRDTLSEREAALTARRGERDEMSGRLGEMRATVSALKNELDQLEPRLALLKVDSDAECPVCRTQLGQHGIERAREHFQQRKGELGGRIKAITAEGLDLRKRFDALESEVRAEEAALKGDSARVSGDIGSLETQAAQAQTAADGLTGAEDAVAAARDALQALPRESDDLHAVRQEIEDLGYDAAEHEAAQKREAALREWDDEKRELDDVAIRVDGDRARLVDVERDLSEREESLKAEQAREAELGMGIEGLDGLLQQATDARSAVSAMETTIRDARAESVRLDERLEQLAKRREERDGLRDEERHAGAQASIHHELEQAFGKNGAQALLIETALPELEDDANELLGRMTGGAMRLNLQTERPNQSGSIRETLEVIISDLQGTRPYEMYSGGEAFRINFALRIALSKLLARRAGAEVPVLFIDEGFGSQDVEGRDLLLEAISTLWNDPLFHDGLILVITHIDDVRERFETRIDIIKTEDGSRYSLSS